MSKDDRVYEIFSLPSVMQEFPPDPESAARRRAEILVKSDTLRVVLITALQGSKLNEHSAPGPITVQVVEGSFIFTIEDEPRTMEKGDVVIVAPGVMHAVECVNDGAILLTIAHLSYIPDTGGDS